MTFLISGLLLFFAVHLIKPLLPQLRESLVEQYGEIKYKIIYSLIAGIGLALIIYGYIQAQYVWLWTPLAGSPHVTHGLMLPAALLLVAADFPNSWGKKVKHPMMIGTVLWAVAHLWSNGHLKALLLFGSFAVFATFMLIKSDWKIEIKPKPIWLNSLWIVVSLAVYGIARYLHLV